MRLKTKDVEENIELNNKDDKRHINFKKIFLFLTTIILIITGTVLYGRYISTSGLIIKEYKITNKNITDNFHGLKVVQISDIHYGRTVNKEELESLVDKINFVKPDIVVLTGDLIDKDTKLTGTMAEEISSTLSKIDVSINKYAIMGNHDYKFKNWAVIIENSGFINLDDNYDLVYKSDNNYMLITGLSTNTYGDKSIEEKLSTTNDYLATLTEDSIQPEYKILIMHEPDYIDDFDYSKYNLVLAGHSHNGQVRLPIIGALILPPGAKKYYKEYYKLNNTDLYISSGVGTSSINFRFFNKPSFNLYRITNK